MKEQNKIFYIYSIKKELLIGKSFRDLLARNHIEGCIVSFGLEKDNDYSIYILDKKFESDFVFIDEYIPIYSKFEGEVLVDYKERSKNTNHTLVLSFGRAQLLRHYSEGIIKKLRELKLIIR